MNNFNNELHVRQSSRPTFGAQSEIFGNTESRNALQASPRYEKYETGTIKGNHSRSKSRVSQ